MRLLLAEDEHELSRALSVILGRGGYEVVAVYDGQSALDHLLAGDVDAAVLDIMMPRMDGIEVLRRARARGIRTPIIMLTAKGEVADKVEGLDAGANDYLAKPFSAKELMARIRAMTRPDTAASATTLVIGSTRLDCDSCMLAGPKGEEHLANREFQLMRFFMERPATRFPTERLLVDVWGDDAPEEPSVVWVYISYLRRRLTAVGSGLQITAARNQGSALERADPKKGE